MKHHFLASSVLFLFPAVIVSAAQDVQPPSAAEVVARMLQQDAQRQTLAQGYSGMRRYVLENEGMHKHAEMLVRVSGDSDGTKHFEVVSEQGWKAAHKHVLRKMLDSESKTSTPEARANARLSTDNYQFQMAGQESVAGRNAYVIEVSPRRRDQYLFAGRVWVDTEDYALVRAEGNPSKNPSFWTKRIHFIHTYQKNGELWFPLCTESVTDARLFGRTDLTIEYFDYKPKTTQTAIASAMGTQKIGRQ